MSITVTPTLSVAGAAVAGSLAGGPALVAVDSARITWGRSSALEQPTAATAALTLLDTSPAATFARRAAIPGDLIGQLVVLGWAGSDGSSGVNFRGRITDVGATPQPGGGFRVTLAASSIEVDLANHAVGDVAAWPAETVAARRDRIAALLPAGRFTGGIALPDRFDLGMQDSANPAADDPAAWPLGPLDPSRASLLELLRQLFTSISPLPLVYDPATDRLRFAARRRYTYSPVGMTQSARLVTDPDRGGRYVPASLSGLHLDAAQLAYAGPLTQAVDSRISWVQVTYLNPAASYAQAMVEAGTPAYFLEDSIGRRLLTVDSVLADATRAQQVAWTYADVATREAAFSRLGALGYSTSREPFPDAAHAGLLLAGAESGAVLFVGGSWLPRLGASPLLGCFGATITYAAGEWSVDLTPAPVVVDPAPFTWVPVPIDHAAAAGVTLAQLDRSVTFGDFAFVDVGAGINPADALPYPGNPL